MNKICIDAGHGGRDSGAVGKGGLKESVVNLAICEELSKRLRAMGIPIMMTRTRDEFIELSRRAQIANEWSANWFVSVHLNSNGPTANGIETLYRTDSGKRLAELVQRQLIALTGERDRGLKLRVDLAVLNQTRMPAILPEVGFISNEATEAKFRTDSHRALVADAIVRGIIECLGGTVSPPASIAPPAPTPIPRVLIEVSTPEGVTVDVIYKKEPRK